MGMTLTQKILAAHAGMPKVEAGDLIICNLDLVLGNDVTTPVAIKEFKSHGFDKVFDNNKIAIVLDHYTPCKDISSAKLCKSGREFAKEYNITYFYDTGRAGIEHALLPEQGLVGPGEVIIGADSHTCTYGALGAFSTGVGSTDMCAGMYSGKAWFKVPDAIKVVLKGKLNKYVSGKDVILHLIGEIGVDGALYKSLEFVGEGVKSLSIDDRFTICNMAIEAGAKNGIFEVDDITMNYLKGRYNREVSKMTADNDAVYSMELEIDLDKLMPTVSLPHLPSNTKTLADNIDYIPDQVVIGSCTNGRFSDLELAASILKGRKVANDVRCIIIPATQEIYKQCIDKGLMDIFIDANCAVSTPTCGPCLGGHMGVMADGEKAITTTNRNFVGRMGDTSSKIILASPLVAAASAVLGKLPNFDEFKELVED